MAIITLILLRFHRLLILAIDYAITVLPLIYLIPHTAYWLHYFLHTDTQLLINFSLFSLIFLDIIIITYADIILRLLILIPIFHIYDYFAIAYIAIAVIFVLPVID